MAWTAGDAERILKVVGLAVTQFNIDLVSSCMDTLEGVSAAAKTDVENLLDDFDVALAAHSAQNLAGVGRTLVQADVLKWEADKGGNYSYSPMAEVTRIYSELMRYFGDCLGLEPNEGGNASTTLYRS
jgi:hypothetical protein